MCAAKDDRVDLRVAYHEVLDTFLYKIVGTRTVVLIVLHKRHPHRTRLARDGDVGKEFLNLEHIALTPDGSLGGHNAHMAALRDTAYALGRRPYDAQHAAVGVEPGQVVLLNRAQSLCRRRVAGKDYEMATHAEKLYHSLARELINHVERARSVRRTRIIAKIKIIIVGQNVSHLVQNC